MAEDTASSTAVVTLSKCAVAAMHKPMAAVTRSKRAAVVMPRLA